MTYWLCIITPENYEIMKKENVWGVKRTHKKSIYNISIGDKLIVYVTYISEIRGIFEVISDVFEDRTEIFKGGLFPYRVKVKPIITTESGIDIRKLTDKLSIFIGKKNWPLVLRGKALIKLNEDDYELIYTKLKELL